MGKVLEEVYYVRGAVFFFLFFFLWSLTDLIWNFLVSKPITITFHFTFSPAGAVSQGKLVAVGSIISSASEKKKEEKSTDSKLSVLSNVKSMFFGKNKKWFGCGWICGVGCFDSQWMVGWENIFSSFQICVKCNI